MNGKLKKEAIKLLLVQCSSVFSASFLFSTYTLFLLNRGVNLFQIGLISAIFSLGIIVFQIPTGALADIWGRKKTYLLSILVLSLSFLIYLFSKKFMGFVLAELLWAFACSLESGCLDAHIWESIIAEGKTAGIAEQEIENSNKKLAVWTSISTGAISAFGGCLGAFLAAKNFNLPWLLSSVLTLLSFFVALLLLKNDKPRKISFLVDIKKMSQAAVSSIKISLNSQSLISLMVFTFLLRLSTTGIFNFWEPQAVRLNGGKIAIFGLVWVLIEMAAGLGSYIGEKVANKLGEIRTFTIFLPLLLFVVIGMIFSSNFWSLIILMLTFQMLVSINDYVYGIKKQTEISLSGYGDPENSLRATILSLFSMVNSIGGVIGLLAAGWVANSVSIQTAWAISVLSIMLTFVYIVFVLEKKKFNPKKELVSEIA